MLDIKFVRENPGVVKDNLNRRGDQAKVPWVDEVVDNDQKWRTLRTEADALRNKRNKLTEQIAQARREGQDAAPLVKDAEPIPEQVKALEKETAQLESKITDALMNLPNIIHETVPFGKDENDNFELRKWGKLHAFSFQPKDHIDLATHLGLIDLEAAAKVAGARFYYLKGDLV